MVSYGLFSWFLNFCWFRGYSTVDHLQAVNLLVEKTREYRLPLFVAFIDFEKAFDSVEINAVWNATKQQGVPTRIVNLLRKIYVQAASYVQIGEERVPIKIQRGVGQGDTISPKLFKATLEEIFRELDWEDFGININGRKLSNLRFADDIALIANTEEELQQLVTELDEVSRRSGLNMNREKTKIHRCRSSSMMLHIPESPEFNRTT
ncbi:hypothetical protein QR680_016244 [Steinernema hermaphroditum]|uniref:Reverse transcriptase domain-containing protein n=1 Tax=Steinernema hermaphroditum TaxID=289476 RepID=A0AA39LM88_9BILA|nr:hypothetical protein QR680_016244 [Steinernema hermaphroditum]